MKPRPKVEKPSRVAATIAYLRRCQAARAARHPVSYTDDPAWLVNMAINRRAGWPDDPGFSRGSCRPLPDGRYPPKAEGQVYNDLRNLARDINTPRLAVHLGALGGWRRLILERIPGASSRRTDDGIDKSHGICYTMGGREVMPP